MAEDKGGRPHEGEPHTIIIPDGLWQWCMGQGGYRQASEYIRRLIKRDRDEQGGVPRKDLDDLEPLGTDERGAP